jgi:hypothetical protein
MNKILFFLGIGILITSCSNYSVIDENSDTTLGKSIINIRLKNKVDESELISIANKLRKDRPEFKNLYIFYYLPDMTVGSGAWAITHFTPDLEIKILGATKEQGNILDNANVENKEIIGKWRDYGPSMESVNIIFKDNDTLKIKMIYKDGSDIVKNIIKRNENGKVIYNYSDTSFKEYIMVDKNGDLCFYGTTGKYGEAKRIE